MKYLLALQVTGISQYNAVVVYNDIRLLYSTLIDGMTGLPLLFDNQMDCENAQALMPGGYQVIPVHHMILVPYPKKSVFSTNQYYYLPQPC